MINLIANIYSFCHRYLTGDRGVSSIEAAALFPVMALICIGTYDVGIAMMANQKSQRAAQMSGDLLARKNLVSTGDVTQAYDAARSALSPLPTDKLGIDIVSIRFDEADQPVVVWRQTFNMEPEDDDVVPDSYGLGYENEGVIGVVITYEYEPLFASVFVDTIKIREVAYLRGRKNPIIDVETSS